MRFCKCGRQRSEIWRTRPHDPQCFPCRNSHNVCYAAGGGSAMVGWVRNGFEVSGLWIAESYHERQYKTSLCQSLRITVPRCPSPIIHDMRTLGRETASTACQLVHAFTPPNKHNDDIPAPATAWCASPPPRWWPWFVSGRWAASCVRGCSLSLPRPAPLALSVRVVGEVKGKWSIVASIKTAFLPSLGIPLPPRRAYPSTQWH